MALVPIQVQPPRQEKDTLDKIAQAFSIAQGLVGTGLAIPKFIQERKLAKAQLAKEKAETDLIESQSEPVSESEKQWFVEKGMPPSMVPRTRAEASSAMKYVFETPGQKASRARADATLQALISKEEREQAKYIADKEKPKLTFAQEQVDRNFAKTYNTFIAEGGYADAGKNINQLEEVSAKLARAKQEGKNYTGPILGMAEPTWHITYPEAKDMKELVEEVVQRNLRVILGAQFTEKEGTRLIERAYNPKLEEPENKKRIDRLIKQIKSGYKAKVDAARYYEQNGTLKGWTGTGLLTSPDQLLKDEKDKDIEDYAKQFGLTYEQAYKIIENRRNQGAR